MTKRLKSFIFFITLSLFSFNFYPSNAQEKDQIKDQTKEGSNQNNEAEAVNAYTEGINQILRSAWNPLPENGRHAKNSIVKALIRINKDGSTENIEIIESSGSTEIDNSAIKAIKASVPFPSFPKTLKHDSLDIEYSFLLKMDDLAASVTRRMNIDFDTNTYMEDVKSKLRSEWEKSDFHKKGKNSATFEFKINKDGSVENIKVTTSSGDPEIDTFAQNLIQKASPLPAFPETSKTESLTVSYTFSTASKGSKIPIPVSIPGGLFGF